MNLSYSGNDVQWHPKEPILATAATNGDVVIWNLTSNPIGIAAKMQFIYFQASQPHRLHTRTVNRLSWHPDHQFTLMSGCQGGIIKIWVSNYFVLNSNIRRTTECNQGPKVQLPLTHRMTL